MHKRTEDLIKGDAAPATSILDINYNLESQKIQKENIKQQIATTIYTHTNQWNHNTKKS